MYKTYFKRILDFIAALFLLMLLSPIILSTYVLLLVINDGNAFFFQVRPGYNCKPFTIIKFKTMRDEVDSKGNLLSDDLRLTRIGKIVRALSIDELLQLINVIKGDMSLVGPRPLLMHYLPRYSSEQIRRHNVKPGITGWAQVNGRNAISWDLKFKYDVYYVENQSFFLDIKILMLTFIKVIQKKGINSTENITMEEFRGELNN
jgi:lipopolysaccharide/colanic/teichoic acid biosynthesis glycosyltransferase